MALFDALKSINVPHDESISDQDMSPVAVCSMNAASTSHPDTDTAPIETNSSQLVSMCTRFICHELANSLGLAYAVNKTLKKQNAIMSSSLEKSVAQLRFFRLAFCTQPAQESEYIHAITSFLGAHQITWSKHTITTTIHADAYIILMNAILMIMGCMIFDKKTSITLKLLEASAPDGTLILEAKSIRAFAYREITATQLSEQHPLQSFILKQVTSYGISSIDWDEDKTARIVISRQK